MKWIDIPVTLFTYQCIEFSDTGDDIVPVYKEVTAPDRPPRPPGPYSIDDRYAYITDPTMRSMAQKLVDDIKGWDPQRILVEAIKYAISIKHSGRVIALVEPRRKGFVLSTYNEEGKWTGQNMSNEMDIEQFLPVVRTCFERVRG